MRNRIPGGFDMNVNILTSGYWPSYPIVDAKMPAELSDYQQARIVMIFALTLGLDPRRCSRDATMTGQAGIGDACQSLAGCACRSVAHHPHTQRAVIQACSALSSRRHVQN